MKECAFLGETHHLTDMARVAISDQQGEETNYVVICCMPSMNGLYKGDATKKKGYSLIMNNKKACYCVPVSDLKYVGNLEGLPDAYKEEVKKNQAAWLKHEKRKEKPEWML